MPHWNKLLGQRHNSRTSDEPPSTETLVDMEGIPAMAGGAPTPFVLADEHRVRLFYYLQVHDPDWDGSTVRIVDVDSDAEPSAVIRFNRVLWHRLGPPNEEAIGAHRLCRLGLHPYTAKEVLGSQLLQQFCDANRIHPYHKDSLFEKYRHFAIAFHDSVFEVIAQEYSAEKLGTKSVLSAAMSELEGWRT